MFSVKYFGVFIVVLAVTGKATSLECFVCRGCTEVSPDDLQTCSAGPATESETESTTDHDMDFDLDSESNVQVVDTPYLEEEEVAYKFVLDQSELPGSEYFSRKLQQFRNDEDDARCVLAIYEVNGSTNVVRGCSTASEDQESRCLEAVGDSDVSLVYCNLCDEDLCNSAARSVVAAVIVVFGVLLTI